MSYVKFIGVYNNDSYIYIIGESTQSYLWTYEIQVSVKDAAGGDINKSAAALKTGLEIVFKWYKSNLNKGHSFLYIGS